MPSLQERLDEDFMIMLTQIEDQYRKFNRHIQIRIEKWVELLVQCDQNLLWKKSRNLYIELLYEMVQRNWVGAMFLRMPPSGGIPNLKEGEFKMLMQDVKSHPKEIITWRHNQILMKKVAEPLGDVGTCTNTPNCVTDRAMELQEPKIFYHEASTIKQLQENQMNLDSFQPQDLLEGPKTHFLRKIALFLQRNNHQLGDSQQYPQIIASLNNILCCKNSKPVNEDSMELQVQQGIQSNKVNLFQFGSPRGMTQMRYFKATLHL